MKYSLHILKNKNYFKRQISFPKCIEHQIFLTPQLQLLRVFEYHLTNQSLTSRKWYAQKTSGCSTVESCYTRSWNLNFAMFAILKSKFLITWLLVSDKIDARQRFCKVQHKFKDIINPYTCLLKNANFSVKTSNE